MQEPFAKDIRQLFEAARELYESLHRTGADTVNIADQDVVTEVDRQMTDLIIDHFSDDDRAFAFRSEELTKSQRDTTHEAVDYTVIFDEIDGTTNMKDGTGPFGPIIGIAEGVDPAFADMVAAGFMNLQDGTTYEAYRDSGAFRTAVGDRERIRAGDRTATDGIMRLLIDQAMLGKAHTVAEAAWCHHCNDYGAMGQHLCWVADGSVDAFITGGFSHMPEKDRQTAEEIGPLYRLIAEAGGAVTDWHGEPIAGEPIGMHEKKNHNVIAAATEDLAAAIARDIIPETYQ